jgi:S-layer family protein
VKKISFYCLIILVIISLWSLNLSAAVKFNDMDDDHWAARSVYNVVRLGITRGYPDGTFRGEKQVNRYEVMAFLSNLSIIMEQMMDQKIAAYDTEVHGGLGSASANRILEELKAEIATLRAQLYASELGLKPAGAAAVNNTTGRPYSSAPSPFQDWNFSGDFNYSLYNFRVSSDSTGTNYVSQRARLKAAYQDLEHGFMFDLDSGCINPSTQGLGNNITNNVLAFSGWVKSDIKGATLKVEASAGPGDLELNDYRSNGAVTRSGTVIYRPGNTIKMTWSLGDVFLSGHFEKRTGSVDRTIGLLGYDFTMKKVGAFKLAAGSETYSRGGTAPMNSPRSIYKITYKPTELVTINARGSHLKTYYTEEQETFTEGEIICLLPWTDTTIKVKNVRLTDGFYSDAVSDEIAGVNILGYKVLENFIVNGVSVEQPFADRFYVKGSSSIATSLGDTNDAHLYQENATQFKLGWEINRYATFAAVARNTYYNIFNDNIYDKLTDNILAGQFTISF